MIKILDNTGCYFYSENDYFILGDPLDGFSRFNKSHCGITIPYLCRDKSNRYEVGIGTIAEQDTKLVLKRLSVSLSSDNNNYLTFDIGNSNVLYCFANSYNFRTALNNCINTSGNFDVSNIRATYLVDISKDNSTATLPSAQHNTSLVVEFKTSSSDTNTLTIKDNSNIVSILNGGNYTKLISTGSTWIVLKDDIQSVSAANFSSLSTEAAGPSGSLQYSDGSLLAGSNVFVDSNQQLLFGSDTEATAKNILPTTGLSPTVFNNLSVPTDFIVKGSGDRNLFFGHEGRLGLNIPSGARPQTALHIVNNSCQDSIRLENRNPCYSANLTLYHKPTTVVSDNTVISTINLSAKNSLSNQIDFVQFKAKALSTTIGATSGQLSICVDKLGDKIEALIINPDYTTISSASNSIKVSSSGIDLNGTVSLSGMKWTTNPVSGSILVSDSSGNLILTNLNNSPIINLLDPGVIVFTGVCS